MLFPLKILASLCILLACASIARRQPSLAGLLAAMPLTTLLALLWIWGDAPGDSARLAVFCRGAAWGVLPTMAFFLVAAACFRQGWPLPVALLLGFLAWGAGALLHGRWVGREAAPVSTASAPPPSPGTGPGR